MRKSYGLAALSNRQQASSTYSTHGSQLRQSQAAALQTQLSLFRQTLHQFSQSSSKEILSNPDFRREFNAMCQSLGIDPLLGSSGRHKGGSLWGELLGKEVNDFWFQVAVRVVEVCRRSRAVDGGLRSVESVRRELVERGRVSGVNAESGTEIST
jgi:ESCRT-II complex subunit VPS22